MDLMMGMAERIKTVKKKKKYKQNEMKNHTYVLRMKMLLPKGIIIFDDNSGIHSFLLVIVEQIAVVVVVVVAVVDDSEKHYLMLYL